MGSALHPTISELAYMQAADVANRLLGWGLPVLKFGFVHDKLSVTFQLTDERAKYTASLPAHEATPERFRELYEAVK